MMLNPLQKFVLQGQISLADSHLLSLTQCYQAIIGSEAVSVYLTLYSYQFTLAKDSPWRHQRLLEQLKLSPQQLLTGRQQLEALGLLRSFRDQQSHPEEQHQTLIYQLQVPLTAHEFMQDSKLSSTLYKFVGEQHYRIWLELLQPAALDPEQYKEETQAFAAQFYGRNQEELAAALTLSQESPRPIYPNTFNYSQFLDFVMADGMNHQCLTPELKEQVYALHILYGYSESELANIVYQAADRQKERIDAHLLKQLAYQRAKTAKQRQEVPSSATKTEQAASQAPSGASIGTSYPRNYSQEELAERKASLQASYPELVKEDLLLITLCESKPLDVFLAQLKKNKRGFVTDAEMHAVVDLYQRFKIPYPIVNFLVYYILIILDNKTLNKNFIQSIANQWQQEGYQNIAEIMLDLKKEAKTKQLAKKTGKSGTYTPGKARYAEKIPKWLTMADEDSATSTDGAATGKPADIKDSLSEAELRARLARIKEGGGQ